MKTEKKKNENVIEIQEEVKISQNDQNVILEKGDRIKILEKGDKIRVLPKKKMNEGGPGEMCLEISLINNKKQAKLHDPDTGAGTLIIPIRAFWKYVQYGDLYMTSDEERRIEGGKTVYVQGVVDYQDFDQMIPFADEFLDE